MTNTWHSLTWATLEDWAGLRCVERGREYCREGRVSRLCVTAEGDVVAHVRGSQRYHCRVRLEGDRLRGGCTCPFTGPGCKHAVAVTLAYLDALRHGRAVPAADDGELWQFPALEQCDEARPIPGDIDQLRRAIDDTLVWPVPSACEETLPWLRRLREHLVGTGRAAEWAEYEARLRRLHWRMGEVLARLNTRRIIPAMALSAADNGVRSGRSESTTAC